MTGSLQKTKRSQYWYAVICVPNPSTGKIKQKWISTKCIKKREANEVLRALLNKHEKLEKLEKERAEQPEQILFTDYLKKWHKSCVTGFLEETTTSGYQQNLENHIIPYFEKLNLSLHEVKRGHIQDFVTEMHQNGRLDGRGGLRVTSIKKYVANISKTLDQAVIDRLIPENPCSLIRYPKEQPFEARFLKLPDLNTLLEAVHDMVIEPAIILAVYYALRRGEILGIRWSDIDFERNIVYIKNTRVRVGEPVEKGPKNKASLAPMPLMPNVKDYLLILKKQQAAYAKAFGKQYHHNDYICKWQDGRPFEYKYVNSVLGRVLKKNKLPHRTLHELRHSTASLLRAQGFSLQEIQSWLRHGDIKSTMRYAHDDIDVRINASERLNGIFVVQQKVKEVV